MESEKLRLFVEHEKGKIKWLKRVVCVARYSRTMHEKNMVSLMGYKACEVNRDTGGKVENFQNDDFRGYGATECNTGA